MAVRTEKGGMKRVIENKGVRPGSVRRWIRDRSTLQSGSWAAALHKQRGEAPRMGRFVENSVRRGLKT